MDFSLRRYDENKADFNFIIATAEAVVWLECKISTTDVYRSEYYTGGIDIFLVCELYNITI